jgi:colanic acid biosynthesis glycosyl transferase WcaI
VRIAFLTQYYPPEMGAPQARLSEMAADFVRHGHEVTVLTAMPNYPTGRVFPGYGGLVRRENVGGTEVIRTLIYPTQRADFLHRLTSYFSFVTSSAVVGTALLPPSDFLLVETPPLFLGLSGVWLSRIRGARLIFNVSDLWPESAAQLGLIARESRTYRLAERLEAWCYRKAWLVSGQSAGILEDIHRRFPRVPTYHLSNGCDTALFSPERSPPTATREGSDCVALYAGLHGLAQGLDQVLEAAALVNGARVRFVLVGDGPKKQDLVQHARQQSLKQVEFQDAIPKGQMPDLIASADIVIVPLKTYIQGAVPSKIYEAMASARPLVLVAEGEAASIVERADAGLVVRPGDTVGLAEAVRKLAGDPALRRRLGNNGRRAALACYDRSRIDQKFIRFLEEAVAKRSPAPHSTLSADPGLNCQSGATADLPSRE